MSFQGFNNKDFKLFKLEGFEERMKAIKSTISPKLQEIGEQVSPILTQLTGDEIYAHVARHARRTVNPPDNTWVAFADNKRGYKKHPHFQIGLWQSHLFVWFAIIDEAESKRAIAEKLARHKTEIRKIIPDNYMWSTDHTEPDFTIHQNTDLVSMMERLKTVKKAEILCGRTFPKDDPILRNKKQFFNEIEETFETVQPLYQLAKAVK